MTNQWQAPEILVGGERPSMFADVWSLAATLLQWLTQQSSPWDMQDLCTRYKMRHNREMAALMKVIFRMLLYDKSNCTHLKNNEAPKQYTRRGNCFHLSQRC